MSTVVSFEHNLFNQFARAGKALSNGNQLEFLAQSEQNVDELAKVSGLTVANTSQYLQQLWQAGLVTSRKQGLKVNYSLTGDDVISLLNAMRDVTERHISNVQQLVNSYLTVKNELVPIPRKELLQRAKDGLITVLDGAP